MKKKTLLLSLFIFFLYKYSLSQGTYGQTSTLAGSGSIGSANGTGTAASFYTPLGIGIDLKTGNLYVADAMNYIIRKITPAGVVTTFAGTVGKYGYQDGQGTSALFDRTDGIAVDQSGNVYVADNFNNRIRKISPTGLVSTLAGSGTMGSTNGQGTAASFNHPQGVAVDNLGNIFVADGSNNLIRKITPSGLVSTYAGTGAAGSADGSVTSATFNLPIALEFDKSGNLYIADRSNNKIRKITSSGTVSTFAGSGSAGSTNGVGTSASFNAPSGLAVDAMGTVFVTDEGGNQIRAISQSGVVTTLAGSLTSGMSNGIGVGARFYYPFGICQDGNNHVYVTEVGNNAIRLINTTPLPTINVNTDFSNQITNTFAKLEVNRVPMGLLKDIAFEQYDIGKYDGVQIVDTNRVDIKGFRGIYQTVASASINANSPIFQSMGVLDSNAAPLRQPGKIVLYGLYYQYAKFMDAAVTNNQISIVNNQVVDVYINGVWQNPYEIKNVLAITPVINEVQGLSQTFISMPVWVTNNGSQISSFQFDAGDGLGYRTTSIGNANIAVAYPSYGTKELLFKITLTTGAVLLSHSALIVDPSPQEQYPNFPHIPITSQETYLGIPAKGIMTIIYGGNHTSLQNPLIVAEGYDPGFAIAPENQYGLYTYQSFLNQINNRNPQNGQFINPSLHSLLTTDATATNPYDIVFIDYQNGVDDIRRNALLFKQVVRTVNSLKSSAGSTAPNVVLGLSMGGLVARWGLRDMENNGEKHQTSLYISYDSPHQGANVPIGYQYLANEGKALYVRASGFVKTASLGFLKLPTTIGGTNVPNTLSLASYPASLQLLVNNVSSGLLDNSQHLAWQTQLTSMGYPQGDPGKPIRKIAISNGSECGAYQTVQPGGQLFNLTGSYVTSAWVDFGLAIAQTLFPVTTTNILKGVTGGLVAATGKPGFFLGIFPGTNNFSTSIQVNSVANGGGNLIYSNLTTYKKFVFFLIPITVNLINNQKYAPNGALSFDSYAGGRYNLVDFGLSSASLDTGNFFGRTRYTLTVQPTFGFVSTPSALDIGSGNVSLTDADYTYKYVGSNPPAGSKASPFANFTTAADTIGANQDHIFISPKTGNWLYQELLNSPQLESDCSILCGGTTISGPTSFCSSGTYNLSSSIPNDGSVTITWNPVGPAKISSQSGNSVVIVNTGNGNISLSATINTPCGSITIPGISNIQVGQVLPGSDVVDRTPTGNGYQYLTSTVVQQPGSSNFNWYQEVGGVPTTFLSSGPVLSRYPLAPATVFFFQCQAQTACGPSVYRSYAYNTNPKAAIVSGFSISPVPASNQINVTSVGNSPNTQTTNLQTNSAAQTTPVLSTGFDATLLDALGNILVHQNSQTNTQVSLNVSNIPNGIYFLHILDKGNLIKTEVQVRH